jgi:hypothetical protein
VLPKWGERARINLSAEAYNITQSTNKNMGSNAESKSGNTQAAINPYTGFPSASNSFSLPTSSPATDRFGGPRQVQWGVRLVW